MNKVKKIIKLSIEDSIDQIKRQTPNNSLIWKDYKFVVNDDIEEADYWVVYSKGRRKVENCNVNKKNIFFISGEPDSIYTYSKKFLKQFSLVIGVSRKFKHSKTLLSYPAVPWYVGISFFNNRKVNLSLNYNFFSKNNNKFKSNKISVISSNTSISKGHIKRINFVKELKLYFGDLIHIYGNGFNSFDDKWDVISSYKYHIVLENSKQDHYWTEKLSDTFLSNTYPIYYGAENINEYFDEKSMSTIDIDNINYSINKIESILRDNLFSKHFDKILESKNRVLNKYNLVNLITSICEKYGHTNYNKTKIRIKDELSFINIDKLFTKIRRAYYNFKYKINFFEK